MGGEHCGDYKSYFYFGCNGVPMGGNEADYAYSNKANTNDVNYHQQSVRGFGCKRVKSVSLRDGICLVGSDEAFGLEERELVFQLFSESCGRLFVFHGYSKKKMPCAYPGQEEKVSSTRSDMKINIPTTFEMERIFSKRNAVKQRSGTVYFGAKKDFRLLLTHPVMELKIAGGLSWLDRFII